MAQTENAPASIFRDKVGMGVWEHRGKVAAVGIGHSPTTRRWDEKAETSVGAWQILAAQRALDDAGVSLDKVDGVVSTPDGLGDPWGPREIPEDFAKMYQPTPGKPEDGLSGVSADWLVTNMGLKNAKFTMHAPGCMSKALCVATQAVGDGQANTVLVTRVLNNMPGRYHHVGATAVDTASGPAQWNNPWGLQGEMTTCAMNFVEYCRKYGSNHDRMAPFIVNERRNGLMFPEGYYYQHRPEPLTVEDYLSARWVSKPLNLLDADMPIQTAVAYLLTTAERAKDMKQKPVYILNHCQSNLKFRSSLQTLDEAEAVTDILARKLLEGAGITSKDVDVFNAYEGYTLFFQYYLEGFQWHGVKRGEAHDFYAGDISVKGPHPLSSSGGNNGNGRTRWWGQMDTIQQLRGQAGQRQVNIRAETGVAGAFTPGTSWWMVYGTSPD
ncbi:MAG: hypothetical protein ABIH46_11750 [Chloroflexota bacterium]